MIRRLRPHRPVVGYRKSSSFRFTARGWGFVLAGGVALLAELMLGLRDLVYVAVLLLCLPLTSVLVLRLLNPHLSLVRRFQPQVLPVGSSTTVTLEVAGPTPGSGSVNLMENLPKELTGTSHPVQPRPATGGGEKFYGEYRLTPPSRGVYEIGPVAAQFTGPLGMGTIRWSIGTCDRLLVTPAPVTLPPLSLGAATDDDEMTDRLHRSRPDGSSAMIREYLHGDPMRRVHWARTARQPTLMDPEEEQEVSIRMVTLIMDQRSGSFTAGTLASPRTHPPGPTPAFEWALTTVMSIAAHLINRDIPMRLLDHYGAPALLRSPSAHSPAEEEYKGPHGLASIAEGLAGLQLAPTDACGHGTPRTPDPSRDRPRAAMQPSTALPQHCTGPAGVGQRLLPPPPPGSNGPLIAVLGMLTPGEAHLLAPAAYSYPGARAIIIAERPGDCQTQLEILGAAGWHACAVPPGGDLAAVWLGLDLPLAG
ncbi:DUF58 domain-containing protein [Arthrobacter zhaoguopingii]|uniref:DUF58 domain-containing protein n=1 Tax=Arthrobacter zhaoguopingii TaxID=2681491 RepID=UPI00135A64AE|nr:DUF58 domain-containing protein [Arthrobacter zhaoguopingii]